MGSEEDTKVTIKKALKLYLLKRLDVQRKGVKPVQNQIKNLVLLLFISFALLIAKTLFKKAELAMQNKPVLGTQCFYSW